MGERRLTEEEERKSKEMLKEDKKYYEVAEELGISDEPIILKDVNEWRIRYNNKHRWTDEKEEKAKNMLREGKHATDIARVLDICPNSISDRNRYQWKIPVEARREISGVSSRDPDIEKEVCRLYKLGLTRWLINAEIGFRFNTNKSITDIIKKYGYSTDKLKYNPSLDEHYFDFIDTEHKAYFLGLMVADGWITNSKSRGTYDIGLAFESNDRYIIEEFKKELKSDRNIVDRNSSKNRIIDGREIEKVTHSSQLVVTSEIMFRALERLGVTENKTKTLTINPNLIPSELVHHFIRGMIDGDGSIYIGSKNNLTFSLIGTISVIHYVSYMLWFNDITEFKLSYYKGDKYSFELHDIKFAERNEVENIYNYLMKDASIFMTRKWEIAEKWLRGNKIEESGGIH